ncbi:MAG TPA: hypothetical protein VM509_03630, partial [Planctomycetota bacterium]|nr:hypothetical protein [Planctomycetota bacterium]
MAPVFSAGDRAPPTESHSPFSPAQSEEVILLLEDLKQALEALTAEARQRAGTSVAPVAESSQRRLPEESGSAPLPN